MVYVYKASEDFLEKAKRVTMNDQAGGVDWCNKLNLSQ